MDSQGNSKGYKELAVWRKSLDFVTTVYSLSASFPSEETYGLKSQMRRAAVSIPSNIAEGQGRGGSVSEFARFIRISLGSLAEVDTQLEIAKRLEFVTELEAQTVEKLIVEIRKMLYGLLRGIAPSQAVSTTRDHQPATGD